jgi:hypothetical protein
MLNQPGLAILIDFWNPAGPKKRLDDTIEFLSTNNTIKTVVLSTYNSRSELFFCNNTIWYRNRKEWYEKSPTWAKDRSILEDKAYIKNTMVKNALTDARILKYCNPNQYQIAMFQYWEIEHYLSMHPEIKNVYVLGSAWEDCVKYRPLGYLNLSQLHRQNVNILTHTKLVLANQGTFPDLSSDHHWINVEGNVYRYLGNEKVDV